jgi:hypothetical protein
VRGIPSRRYGRTALVLLAALAGTAGCTAAGVRFAARADELGMSRGVVSGSVFPHVVFRHVPRLSPTLHVYLDGDGTPWVAGVAARDPTPRNALVLELMKQDGAPSVYLGRPCYHGLASVRPCEPSLWTSRRYSETVVASMAMAVQALLDAGPFERVVWFGYSGGGTMAMLLAPRVRATVAVVTVAANLDIDRWADVRGYPRLAGSLNPASQPPLAPRILQRHYVGARDRDVPPGIVASGQIPPDTLVVIPTYDHVCCWPEMWADVLADVERTLPVSSSSSGR